MDVVPFYARLVATLDPFMKDVAKGLIVIVSSPFCVERGGGDVTLIDFVPVGR